MWILMIFGVEIKVTPSSYNLSVFMHKKGGDIMMWKMITGLSSYGNRGRDT